MRLKISELTVREPFKSLFPIEPDVVQTLTADMKTNGFDAARSIIVWKASTQERIVVDGHMRLAAARAARLKEIAVTVRQFADEDAAFEFAVASQRDRRNLSKEQIATAIARAELTRNGSKDRASVARSLGPPKGQKGGGGSTKDPVRQAVVEKAAKAGVGERTARKGLANARAERTTAQSEPRKPAGRKTTKASKDPAATAAKIRLTGITENDASDAVRLLQHLRKSYGAETTAEFILPYLWELLELAGQRDPVALLLKTKTTNGGT